MTKIKSSYSFGTQPYVSAQQSFDMEPDNKAPKSSYDLVVPTGGFPTDFVSQSKGGTFLGKVRYSAHFTYGEYDLITKKFVEDSIAAIDLSSAADAHTRSLFSIYPANPLLTYNDTNGQFTLGIIPGDITNWDEAWLWGNHAEAGYLQATEGSRAEWDLAYSWGDHAAQPYLIPPTGAGLFGIKENGDWESITNVTGATELNELSDVTIGTPVNRHSLMHDGTTGFVNRLLVEADISDLQSYLLNINAESIGNLSDVSLAGAADGKILSWDTGSVVLSDLSVLETDPVFGASPAGGIVAGDIVNWNAAHGWGDHATENYLKNLTGLTTDNLTEGAANKYYPGEGAISLANLLSKNHSELTTVLGSGSHHLAVAEHAAATREANSAQSGLLSSVDWNTFSGKQEEITWGSGFVYDAGTDTVTVDLAAVELDFELDDEVEAEDVVWSSTKIMTLFGDTATSYTIDISAGADLPTKLTNGYTAPEGWTLAAVGGTSSTLEITHGLGRLPSSIMIWSDVSNTYTELQATSAYGDMTSEVTMNTLSLTSYAAEGVATTIKLIF